MNRFLELLHDTVSPELAAAPYANLLPKDRVGLLQWRLYVRERCVRDTDFRDAIWQMCAADLVFFAATFVYFHETRETEDQIGKFPAILDSQQRNILALLQKYAGRIDITVEKTRGIGLSYLIVVYLLWAWLFKEQHALEFGLLSKDDSSLDQIGRPSTLMGKLDLAFEELPYWMKHDQQGRLILHRTLKNHRFEHLVTKRAIIGYTATDEKLRSARLYCLFADEAAFLPVDIARWLASAHGTTPSIIYVSTHTGTATLFYHLTRETKKNLLRIACWWWENERCRPGLYKSERGQIVIYDKSYKWPLEGYEFSHEHAGLFRSPWADRAFDRPGANPLTVLEELYGIAGSLSRKLFRPALIAKLRARCQPAVERFNLENGQLVEDLFEGQFLFWEQAPYLGQYVIGVDPALGSKGGAYAGIFVTNVLTGKQTMGARLENCAPVDLARYVVDIAKILCGPRGAGYARVGYESTGIGVVFANELSRLRWPAIAHPEGKDVGGFPNPDRGEAWLVELGRALQDGELAVYDQRLIDDLDGFEYDHEFVLQFSRMAGHGDLAIGAGVSWDAARKLRRSIISREADNVAKNKGIEAEPGQIAKKKAAQTWSNRYRSRI
jgi:hypothetical protein